MSIAIPGFAGEMPDINFEAYAINLKKLFSISIGKKVLFSFLDQGLFSGANFILNLALARWLPNNEYGAFSVAFSMFLLLASFQSAIILEPMAIFGSTRHKKHLPQYIGQLVILQFGLTTIFGLVFALSAIFFDATLRPAFWGVACGLPLILSYWLMRQSCYIESKPDKAFITSGLYFISLISGILILSFTGHLNSWTAFLTMGVCSLISTIVLWRILPVHFQKSDLSSIICENWVFGKWILVASVANWVTVAIYPPLISAFSSLTAAGVFRAMQNLVQPLQQGLIALVIFFLPLMSRFLHEKGIAYLNQITKTIVIVGVFLSVSYTIFLAVAGPYLIRLIYPQNEYFAATWLLPYLGLSIVFNVPALFISLSLRSLEQSSAVMIMKISSAITVITFGTLATALWGFSGIIACLLLSNIIETVVSVILLKKSLIRFNQKLDIIKQI